MYEEYQENEIRIHSSIYLGRIASIQKQVKYKGRRTYRTGSSVGVATTFSPSDDATEFISLMVFIYYNMLRLTEWFVYCLVVVVCCCLWWLLGVT